METLKVAMIGGWSSVVGFKAVGVETFAVATPEDGPDVWGALQLDRYAMVMITEPVYEVLLERVPGFPALEELPVVLAIPSVSGSMGIGRSGIKKKVEKALGSILDI
jgi:V/A-type H+-transporting ATPase subunit F